MRTGFTKGLITGSMLGAAVGMMMGNKSVKRSLIGSRKILLGRNNNLVDNLMHIIGR